VAEGGSTELVEGQKALLILTDAEGGLWTTAAVLGTLRSVAGRDLERPYGRDLRLKGMTLVDVPEDRNG
jgi:hypothetical protein